MNRKDNILDATEKHRGPRTCPECGYKFPLVLFVKRYVLKHGFTEWTCPNCHKLIKYNYVKATVIMTIVFFVSVFVNLGLQAQFGWDIPNYIFIFLYFLIGLVLLSFDTFQRIQQD